MVTGLRLTILCENTVGVPNGVTGEWGLSILLEVPGITVLLDTGAGGALVPNAWTLGHSLNKVDQVVLSHGHYDHTGGLRAFLEQRERPTPVYAHPGVFAERFSLADGRMRPIGLPFERGALESAGAEFRLVTEPLELIPGFCLSGEVPRRFETGDPRLVIKEGEGVRPDPFPDDLSVYVVTDCGLVVILGCAHSGVENIVEYGREVTGINRVAAVIGGTHLGPAAPAERDRALAYLHSLDLDLLSANHCTGLPVLAAMAGMFDSRFRFALAGTIIDLPFQPV